VKYRIIAIVLLFGLSTCAVSPTGRKQLAFMPEAQMIVMGVQSFEQIRKETPAVKVVEINTYVRCVADAITRLPEVLKSSSDWEVVVFDDKTVNAFALPGGKIGVYKGLLSVADSPSQLAAVLGHEVGHVLAHHGNERVSQNFAVNESLALLEGWMAANNVSYRREAMGLIGVGAQVGVLLPFSREHESEADEIGQMLMAKAGFDPRQSVTLWQNMSKNGKAPPEFLSTHPAHKTRIRDLQAHMKKALKYYNKAPQHPVCKMPVIK
jgi:predicted Zn-dependent protease